MHKSGHVRLGKEHSKDMDQPMRRAERAERAEVGRPRLAGAQGEIDEGI